MAVCVTCGQGVVSPADFRPGIDAYDDTPGGHADRHTLVVEAAERAALTTDPSEGDDRG
jgi:hypothetical protein